MLEPVRYMQEGFRTGGQKGTLLCPTTWLVQKIYEGATSYRLTWSNTSEKIKDRSNRLIIAKRGEQDTSGGGSNT